MWGGRFAAGPAAVMEQINASIGFDRRFYAQDIAASKAHAAMLVRQGIIRGEDGAAIQAGLDRVRGEIEAGRFEFKTALEDIHMNVEARLKEIIGEPAGRLHTARSRNDQVATDFRLWVRDCMDGLDAQVVDLMEALIGRAERHADTIMPGMTHLQPAQPVTFGHHLLAYVEMLGRDRGRLADARRRLTNARSAPPRSPAPRFRSTAARRPRRSASTGRPPTRWTPCPIAISPSSSWPPARSWRCICRGWPRRSCCG